MSQTSAMTPEPAPTVQQLLAFYLEAGVDCALTDEPVDRLAEPDNVPAAAPREVAPSRKVAEMPAAMPAVSRSEIAPAPETAIASARRPGATRISRGCRSSDVPANCSTG